MPSPMDAIRCEMLGKASDFLGLITSAVARVRRVSSICAAVLADRGRPTGRGRNHRFDANVLSAGKTALQAAEVLADKVRNPVL